MARGPGSVGWTCKDKDTGKEISIRAVYARIIDISRVGPSYVEVYAPATDTDSQGNVYYFDSWGLNSSVVSVGIQPNISGYQISETYTDTDNEYNLCTAYYTKTPQGPGHYPSYRVSTTANISEAVTTGGGEYNSGQLCTISTDIPSDVGKRYKKYKFLHWVSSSGDTVTTKNHTFTVVGDIAWIAVWEEIHRSGLILYSPSKLKILYSDSKNKILRDE